MGATDAQNNQVRPMETLGSCTAYFKKKMCVLLSTRGLENVLFAFGRSCRPKALDHFLTPPPYDLIEIGCKKASYDTFNDQ
jgi:hypothetical protein